MTILQVYKYNPTVGWIHVYHTGGKHANHYIIYLVYNIKEKSHH
jgi:hypothetical protein